MITNASHLEKLLVEMETGERGFLILEKRSFWNPNNNGKAEFDRILDETKQLLSDNNYQVLLLDKIQKLTKEWLQKAANPEISLRRKMNKNSATAVDISALIEAGTGTGKEILDNLRLLFKITN